MKNNFPDLKLMQELLSDEAYKKSFIHYMAIFIAAIIGFYSIVIIAAKLNEDNILRSISSNYNQATTEITFRAKERTPVLKGNVKLEEALKKAQNTNSANASIYALPAAPIRAVTEEHEEGLLPKISNDGIKPFDAYKKVIKLPPKGRPILALGIEGFGISESLSAQALSKLTGVEATLLISPYTPNLQNLVNQARAKGFETWLNIPFETRDYPYVDTGKDTILIRSSIALNISRIIWAMTRTTGYAGVYGYLDDTFQHSEVMIRSLFNYIFGRGVGYLELKGDTDKIPRFMSAVHKTPYIKSDIKLTLNNYEKDLPKLINTSINDKIAVGIVKLTPALIDKLPEWIKTIEDQGITVVPISAIDDYKWEYLKRRR